METSEPSFAGGLLALETARARYPQASLRLLEHGYDNIVVLVDEAYTFRFPRNSKALLRDQYEAQLLPYLGDAHIGVDLPFVIDVASSPALFITKYVAGQHLALETIRGFSQSLQETIGAQLARFAFALHDALSVQSVLRIREQLHFADNIGDDSWDVDIEQYLGHDTFPLPAQNKIARHYYNKWRAFSKSSQIVVHDDLHSENLLFVDNRLRGVLDFGDCAIGTAEQELRHLYRVNETTLAAGIKEYERLSQRPLDIEAAKAWAIIQDLLAYVRRGETGQTNHPSFIRSCTTLKHWLGMDEWTAEAWQKV